MSFYSTHRYQTLIALVALLLFLSWNGGTESAPAADASPALDQLNAYLKLAPEKRPLLSGQPFAQLPLTSSEAQSAKKLLWEDLKKSLLVSNKKEWTERSIQIGDHTLKFDFRIFGEKPASGRSLVISLHGGGSSPKAVNDQQWQNQKRLYKLEEGVYLAPRAPTDAWNMWFQGHMDQLLERLILDAIIFEDVDPDRVYLTGYSAGGDGVYRLAPRLADHWAGAAMMAGHAGEASPLPLRNLPFAIHVGERDVAYQRNQQAKDWKQKLDDLQKSDPQGYVHEVVLHAGKGHWMDRQDAAAIKWMVQFRRQPFPNKVVWHPIESSRKDFYWLGLASTKLESNAEVTANRQQASFQLAAKGISSVIVRLNDEMMDLDAPITIHANGMQLFAGKVQRTIACMHQTLGERQDPILIFSAQVNVEVSMQ
jgi:hypothetical protein